MMFSLLESYLPGKYIEKFSPSTCVLRNVYRKGSSFSGISRN